MIMTKLQKAILKTLAYADVFEYPLTLTEIHRFLISETKNVRRNTQEEIRKELNKNPYLVSHISYHDDFYFLKGREKIVVLREKREKWSQSKLKIAQKVTQWLKLIPFIKMVAVTGNLAMKNADENADIDLLVVASKNRLWLARLLTVLIVELVANRRHPQDKEVKDKICLNMFLDENHLQIPPNEQDLYSTHEVCQLKPLWQKDNFYQKFLEVNQWIKKFLPNWKN